MYVTYYDLSKKTLEVMERARISDKEVDTLEREIQVTGQAVIPEIRGHFFLRGSKICYSRPAGRYKI